jgi:hypothetical protein
VGHEFSRAVAATAVAAALLLAACGGGDEEADLPPVLDNAREQVEAASEAPDDAADPDETEGAESSPGPTAPNDFAELPAPDLSEYEGANRVVNLWVGAVGETRPIDVWGRRTFTNGPILLAENVGFGESTDYFAAPPGYSLSVVGAGAGPDGEELAGMFNAGAGEQITMIYTNDDDQGSVYAPNLWEIDPDGVQSTAVPPLPGMGLLYLFAPNTRAFGDSLTAAIGADSFHVGDGAGECHYQRIEEEGFQASILGGTQNVQIDLPPGPATITLHPWLSPDRCAQPAALEFVVDVPADRSVMVLVYSTDGQSIETLELPIAPG